MLLVACVGHILTQPRDCAHAASRGSGGLFLRRVARCLLCSGQLPRSFSGIGVGGLPYIWRRHGRSSCSLVSPIHCCGPSPLIFLGKLLVGAKVTSPVQALGGSACNPKMLYQKYAFHKKKKKRYSTNHNHDMTCGPGVHQLLLQQLDI